MRWSLSFTLVITLIAAHEGRPEDVFRAQAEATLDGSAATVSGRSCGILLLHGDGGSQAAFLDEASQAVADLIPGGEIMIALSLGPAEIGATVTALVEARGPAAVLVGMGPDGEPPARTLEAGGSLRLEAKVGPAGVVHLKARATAEAGCSLVWKDLGLRLENRNRRLSIEASALDPALFPPPEFPALRPAIEQSLVEWDWLLQDGLLSVNEPVSPVAAIERTLTRGDALLADHRARGIDLGSYPTEWEALRQRLGQLPRGLNIENPAAALLWRDVHLLRRKIALANPLAKFGPLVFVKSVPSMFSHQLTQYTGNCARPGGGVFVLEKPGRSMEVRRLAPGLPAGSFQFAEVSPDGRRVLFAFCEVDTAPVDREAHLNRFFHLYEASADGTSVRRLTEGPFDDFAGRYLPDGRIVFVSSRRGGYHRCGQGPCAVHTLAVCNADGSDPRPVSYHETHEWDPCVLNDGRVIYTRWDYVDRNAVHYQQLWTTWPDGSHVSAYYGNHTLNPIGIWEARPVPGSSRVMATAAAHHAMTAGSVVLVDVARGVDGLEPLTRLTPEVPFPESEAPVSRRGQGTWHSPDVVDAPPSRSPDSVRWPGHCYKSPYPLSETYFLASYSFEPLIGEPDANPPNQFGLYLVDAFGNKELLYRDPNVSSLWAVPLASRRMPRALRDSHLVDSPEEGVFFVHDVHRSWPRIEPGSVKGLRIVQVLPKTTWHANQPTLGLPSISPGKQILGTVPVEADGSALFRVPSRTPLLFQALDEHGQALQTMRSLTYLQPGELSSCIGCHEHRMSTPEPSPAALALSRDPSRIRPGPDGSNPLSYPILVQPVLDRNCVACHGGEKPEGGVVLTGEPDGRYTASYNALAPLVPYSDWAGRPGDFRVVNSEPITVPGFFGAKASGLMKRLREGHHGVTLAPGDDERLSTWMDANALFYGTFDPEDQARQQRGERIAGPKLR